MDGLLVYIDVNLMLTPERLEEKEEKKNKFSIVNNNNISCSLFFFLSHFAAKHTHTDELESVRLSHIEKSNL